MLQHWPKAEAWGRIRTEIRKYVKISPPYCPTQFFSGQGLPYLKKNVISSCLFSLSRFIFQTFSSFPLRPYNHLLASSARVLLCVEINQLFACFESDYKNHWMLLPLALVEAENRQSIFSSLYHSWYIARYPPSTIFFFEIRKFQHAQVFLMRKLSNAFDDIAPILLLDKLELKTILYTWLHGFI